MTPGESFNYAWACQLLDEVLAEMEGSCRRSGQQVHWEVFCKRVVRPILDNVKPPSLVQLCRAHHIADEAKASNMVVTMKRRFQAGLRRHVRQSVDSNAAADEEILDLIRILSGPGAGS
jgi:hypothetical protein